MNVIKGRKRYKPMIIVLMSVYTIEINYSWKMTQNGVGLSEGCGSIQALLQKFG